MRLARRAADVVRFGVDRDEMLFGLETLMERLEMLNEVVVRRSERRGAARGRQPICRSLGSLLLKHRRALLQGETATEADALRRREVPIEWLSPASEVRVMGTFDEWTTGVELSPESIEDSGEDRVQCRVVPAWLKSPVCPCG